MKVWHKSFQKTFRKTLPREISWLVMEKKSYSVTQSLDPTRQNGSTGYPMAMDMNNRQVSFELPCTNVVTYNFHFGRDSWKWKLNIMFVPYTWIFLSHYSHSRKSICSQNEIKIFPNHRLSLIINWQRHSFIYNVNNFFRFSLLWIRITVFDCWSICK